MPKIRSREVLWEGRINVKLQGNEEKLQTDV